MGIDRESLWKSHYERLAREAHDPWLDLSNEPTHVQTMAISLEAAGTVYSSRCLDVGTGTGQLAMCLSALGASEVVGIDLIPELVDACRKRAPWIRWECGSPSDEALLGGLGLFDRVFAVELLQYVEPSRVLRLLWNRLRPGGRLVAVVPNPGNAIVGRTVTRFEGAYRPISPAELQELARTLPALEECTFRGMTFLSDQRWSPYSVGPFGRAEDIAPSANRYVAILARDSPDLQHAR